MLFLVIFSFATLILCYNFFPNGSMGNTSACTPVPKNLNVCMLNDTLNVAKGEFRFLISFVLAGFVGISVSMWSLRRQNYASLCGNTRNININIAACLRLDPDNQELMLARRRMGRWTILAFELAILKARGHMDSSEGKTFLTDSGLLEVKNNNA